MEIWKIIPGWEDYQVSSTGRVKSNRPLGRYEYGKTRHWRIIKGWKQDGYRMTTLTKKINGKSAQRQARVHQLMLLTFKGMPKKGQRGRHLNDLRSDNRLENLAWGTQKENMEDAKRNGKICTAKQILKKKRYMKGNKHLLGHKHSKETRAKMSASQSQRRQREVSQ